MKSLADALGISNDLEKPANSVLDSKSNVKSTAKQRSREILTSDEYNRSLMRRLTTDSLAPAVECKLYDYAYGKPADRVEVKDVTERLDGLSVEELESRLASLLLLARTLRPAHEDVLGTANGEGNRKEVVGGKEKAASGIH